MEEDMKKIIENSSSLKEYAERIGVPESQAAPAYYPVKEEQLKGELEKRRDYLSPEEVREKYVPKEAYEKDFEDALSDRIGKALEGGFKMLADIL